MSFRLAYCSGAGASGSVVVVENAEGEKLAVKQTSVLDKTSFLGAIREGALLSMIRHPFIVSCKGISLSSPLKVFPRSAVPRGRADSCFFFFEPAKGNLSNHPPKEKGMVIKLAFQILSALDFLHQNCIIHADLRPENILLVGDDYKICDFGNSFIFAPSFPVSQKIVIEKYRAPRTTFEGCVGPEDDVWSLGLILWWVLTEQDPSERKPFPIDPEFVPLMNGLLEKEPEFRLTAMAALELPIFSKLFQSFPPRSAQTPSSAIQSPPRPSPRSALPQPCFDHSAQTPSSAIQSLMAFSEPQNPPKPKSRPGIQVFETLTEFRDEYKWCTYQMILHGLWIYDWYLAKVYQEEHNQDVVATGCLYLAVKIFCVDEIPRSFESILFEDVDAVKAAKEMEVIERQILEKLEWKILKCIRTEDPDWKWLSQLLKGEVGWD